MDAIRPARIPKLCGLDAELGNFVTGSLASGGTGYEAARALIEEFDGLPGDRCIGTSGCNCSECIARRERASSWGSGRTSGYGAGDGAESRGETEGASYGYKSQDWNRRFLASNGGCAYVDLGHLELCIPEVLSAYDHVACWHAMLSLARRALSRANQKQPPGRRIVVLVNNSDGNGNSYGSHLNFLITREAWDNLFERKIQHMLFLAAFQASSIVFTGQGKVGSENGAPRAAFQLSQRADFFERLSGVQTTYSRPIVNSRDEALCGRRAASGRARHLARLHVIFFDNTLSQVASLLKVGVTQMVLAMIEAGRIDVRLILDDPVDAVVRWSHDPSLDAKASMCSGEQTTAVELQLRFLEQVRDFVEGGGCEGVVPRAGEILALWEDTLKKLEARAFEALAPRLDWALKLSMLERARQQRGIDWDDPAMRHLDLSYSSLDAADGLYWACEKSGLVERVVPGAEIERFTHEPPADTRAWSRAMLLRRAGPNRVADVDWDFIRFQFERAERFWSPETRTLDMPDPLALSRSEAESVFERHASLEEVLDRLEAWPAAAAFDA